MTDLKPDPMFHFREADLEKRYGKRGKSALRGVPSACVVLKCVECSGMSHVEARNCKITSCPLFPLNVRYLKKKTAQKRAAAERRKEKT